MLMRYIVTKQTREQNVPRDGLHSAVDTAVMKYIYIIKIHAMLKWKGEGGRRRVQNGEDTRR